MKLTKLFAIFSFYSVLFFSTPLSATVASWDEFKKYISDCGPASLGPSECKEEIKGLIKQQVFWGDTNHNYLQGNDLWNPINLSITFHKVPKNHGKFSVKINGKEKFPEVSLPKGISPFDLLIILNHEMVYFANSQIWKKTSEHPVKVENCISENQVRELENEKLAYLSDIYFWKSSPDWFKIELRHRVIEEEILPEKKLNFSDFYRKLEEHMVQDGDFIKKRLVEMGKYPKCVLNLKPQLFSNHF